MGYKIAFLVSHPTQFEVPFFRYHEKLHGTGDTEICIDVYYVNKARIRDLFDREIQRPPGWDFDDQEGYSHFAVPPGTWAKTIFFWRIYQSYDYDAVIFSFGYRNISFILNFLIAKAKKIPLVYRGDSILLYNQNSIKAKAKKIILQFIYSFFDAFLAVGTLSRQAFVHYGVSEKKIFLFPYIPDIRRFNRESLEARERKDVLRKKINIKEDAVVFIAVTKFVAREGPMDVVKAFAEIKDVLPQAILLLVGDGPQRNEILDYIKKKSLSNIVPLGYQPYSLLPVLYGISDVFIHPAHEECWGVSVNEAMACGLPIILSDCVGSGADLLKGNGFSYKAGNISQLVKCIIKLTENKTIRKNMGNRSWDIIQQWNFNLIAKELQKMIHFVRNK